MALKIPEGCKPGADGQMIAIVGAERVHGRVGMMRYYDLTGRNWTRKIQPHLQDAELNRILVRDFNQYTFGRWRQEFLPGMVPRQFESCDWGLGHRGPEPRYWAYVKHAACHYLVNWNLRLAMLVEPVHRWRIVTSDRHSTVWNGDDLLFDCNFLALGVRADECFAMARKDGEELAPGEYVPVYLAEHYTADLRRAAGR